MYIASMRRHVTLPTYRIVALRVPHGRHTSCQIYPAPHLIRLPTARMHSNNKRSMAKPAADNQKRAKTEAFSTAPRRLVPLEKLPPLEITPAGSKGPVVIDPRATDIARKILGDVWEYPTFILEQEAAITRLICGGNAAVVFPTGGGKSLVYQIPALAFDLFDEVSGKEPGKGVTLVVSPLIALMKVRTGLPLTNGERDGC